MVCFVDVVHMICKTVEDAETDFSSAISKLFQYKSGIKLSEFHLI